MRCLQCTSCWCPRDQLHDTDQVFSFRDTQSIRAELETEWEQLLNQDGTPRERCRERVRYFCICTWYIHCIYLEYDMNLNGIYQPYVLYMRDRWLICLWLVEQQPATRVVVGSIPAGSALEVWPWTSVLTVWLVNISWASPSLLYMPYTWHEYYTNIVCIYR